MWYNDGMMDVEIDSQIVKRSVDRVERTWCHPLRRHLQRNVVVDPTPVLLNGEELFVRLGNDIPLIVRSGR